MHRQSCEPQESRLAPKARTRGAKNYRAVAPAKHAIDIERLLAIRIDHFHQVELLIVKLLYTQIGGHKHLAVASSQKPFTKLLARLFDCSTLR